jgi:hypothetical protein
MSPFVDGTTEIANYRAGDAVVTDRSDWTAFETQLLRSYAGGAPVAPSN